MIRVVSRSILFTLACVSFISGALGQAALSSTPLPHFDVISVKPSTDPRRPVGLFTYAGGRVLCSACPLQYLVMSAFHVESFQVSGSSEWEKARDSQFDVEAKPPADSMSAKSQPTTFKDPPNEEQRQMLQALLADRFHLRLHREEREGPAYLLSRGDRPLKLTPAKDPAAFSWAGPPEGAKVVAGYGLAGINITMPQLSARLSGFVRRPVLDQTELAGAFDFSYRIPDPQEDEATTVTITNSLRELGLRLVQGRGPVETIIVDSVEKPEAN